jgi:hypothetical protein
MKKHVEIKQIILKTLLKMQYLTSLKSLLLFIVLYFITQLAGAQECSLTLDKAQKLYDAGVIEDIPEMLAPCIEHGFLPQEQLQAYKLIILSYLFDQNFEMADKNMLRFLKKYPEYQPLNADPAEFVQLFKSYHILRVFSFGVIGGGNLAFPLLTKSYTVNSQGLQGKYKNFGLGFQAGIKLDFYLSSRLAVNIEGEYFTDSYAYNLDLAGLQNIHSKETQTKLEFPVLITYDFGKDKIRPYLSLGGSLDYLISDVAQKDLIVPSQNIDISGVGINLKSSRRQLNYNIVLGCGVKYKITKGFVFFDIRWKQGLFNQVLSNTRYNSVETFKYQNPDNDYILNNLIFSVGYIHSIFKAKKKI